MADRLTKSRSASISSSTYGNRNLPEDSKPSSPKRDFISAERKDSLARGALAYANVLGKTAGLITVGPHRAGELCGGLAGMCIGKCAQGIHAIFSSKPKPARTKKGDGIYATVWENGKVVGGLALGGPALLAGGVLNIATLAPVAGKLATHHMDKNNPEKKDRTAYSWRLKDDEQHTADSKKSEPRMPILHSRHRRERLGFGGYHFANKTYE